MKKKLLAFGMAVLMLTGCGSSSGTIRFGAAGLGGTYHMFSDAFAEIIESESADCSIEVKTELVFTNQLDAQPPTGAELLSVPYWLMGGTALAGLLGSRITGRRRKDRKKKFF